MNGQKFTVLFRFLGNNTGAPVMLRDRCKSRCLLCILKRGLETVQTSSKIVFTRIIDKDVKSVQDFTKGYEAKLHPDKVKQTNVSSVFK